MSTTNTDLPSTTPSLSSSPSTSPSSSPTPSTRTLPQPSSSLETTHKRTPSRPSLLSSSVSKAQHEVFDLGIENGAPRLITCVKTSQGFDWNMEIFLPSHCDLGVSNLTDRPDPVHEIIISEEERAKFWPA